MLLIHDDIIWCTFGVELHSKRNPSFSFFVSDDRSVTMIQRLFPCLTASVTRDKGDASSTYWEIPQCLTFLVRPLRQALFCCCFLFIFNNSFQSNYVNIYRIEFRQVCTVGRTMAVDAQSELVFRSLKGSPCQLVSDIHRIEFGWHLADGVSVR